MNLFNEPWIPTEGGLQTFWGILSDTDTDHQLLVNSQEFEMQFIHLLCCMGSIALQPKSGSQIRKLIKSVDIKQAQANIKPFADLFDTDNFMQDLVFKEEIETALREGNKTLINKTNNKRSSVQMINGHPKTGSSVKTHRFKCDTLEDICDSCAAPMILNYHTFLTPMFSSKAVNGAAYNGTLNFIVGKNLRDTIILNALVDDYSMIESLINKTELLTKKRQFPNFSMCGGDEKEKENISFNTLNIFEKLFHITTKLYVPTEQRQGICQCCDQERRRFIQAGGFFTNGTEIKNRININRDNVSHPYMPTLTSQEKDGPKIRPWDNNIPYLWSGLAEYITGKVDDGKYGIEIAQNVRLFCEGKIRYKHQTGLGLLNYAWNQASIKRRLYETYSLTNGMSEYQAERVSELIQGINRVRNRMLASVCSNTIIFKGRTIRVVDNENNDISISKILGGSKDKKKLNNLRNKMQSDYLSLCDKKIPELLSLDLTDQKSKEYASNIIRDIVTRVFNKNLNWLERKGQASKHIALLYKNSREISKIYN